MADKGIPLRELDPRDRYKLLCGVIVPRPIALVTTLDENGAVNAAPFSFFNVFSESPALIVLGLQHKPDHMPKDTTRNIHRSGEFVVHMVDEALSGAMNDCAVDFPSGDSEVAAAGLATLPSVDVKVPRLAAAPFALECRRRVVLTFSPDRGSWSAKSCGFMPGRDSSTRPPCMSISTPTGRSAACSASSIRPSGTRSRCRVRAMRNGSRARTLKS
jgi:flavin reductase (DIM6/NTAB) family NADH-FMN oxidoreductase RutF